MDADVAKRLAAQAAADLVPEQAILGLGTGTTTRFFINEVGRLVKAGRKLSAVPTSSRSRELAVSLQIPLLDDVGPWSIDVCVDGADEVSAELDLIKGGGGAHTREKIVNRHSRQNVIIVDESKISRRLGEKRAVPVEVVVFGHRATASTLARFGDASLRFAGDNPFVTDSGNYIYDVETGPIPDPVELEEELRHLPGVVETGLFCGRADIVIVAGENSVELWHRDGRRMPATKA
ncbi:MAG TPA: ribose-5-phosphate isomerase RpiA [Polyangiaceae bacterium]|jgi:ribose 5-phosphate isomerase A|nr:ribose-5-phosphate isomerase RpiA [Polyangiaceae bacterium]